MTTIYLLRHGEIPAFSPRRFLGHIDLPLTEQGRSQMKELGRFLQSRAIGAIYCSPLLRCRESAEIFAAAFGCAEEVVPDLAELDLGQWEGLTVEEVRERFQGGYEARDRDIVNYWPPGGESFADLAERAWPAFAAIADSGSSETRPVAVVAHAGANRVLLCRLLGMPLANLFRLEQRYGCCNVVRIVKGGYRVEGINICSDLHDMFMDK